MPVPEALRRVESLLEDLSLPRDFFGRLGSQLSQVSRQISIDQISAQEGSIGGIEIDKVQLGSATIGNIRLANTTAHLENSSAQLKNVRTIMQLEIFLDWEVDLGWLGDWSGSNRLGELDIPFNLGDLSIPDLDDLHLTIPSINIPEVVAEMAPITDLPLGQTSLSKVKIFDTQLPSSGFTLTGMGVGSVNASNITVPGTQTGKVTIQGLSPAGNVVLPGASLSNLSVPSTNIGQVRSGPFETTAETQQVGLEADLGILAVGIRVKPSVFLDVGSMTISDLQLSLLAGQLDIENISLPLSVEGITVSELDLSGLKVNQLSL